MDYRVMGNVIKKRRNALRITQEQLAEMINKSTVYISLIESGARRPSLETLLGISTSLKLSVDAILFNKALQAETGYVDEFAFLMADLEEEEIEFVMDLIREVLRHMSGGKIVSAARSCSGRSRNRRRVTSEHKNTVRKSGDEQPAGEAADPYSIYHDDGFDDDPPVAGTVSGNDAANDTDGGQNPDDGEGTSERDAP